ncbi:hypothetical protein FA13DRAFT_528987 [Coprinellus micaceus]|uniref:Uncharacterized protein n=1 Tax=Coprinellus micaceus TaxID=71717 RepID=A0A4Y7T9V8_COPMI|nr:hypothetical protein FA13DRAFT_528987 [Coprinellus micaceus]
MAQLQPRLTLACPCVSFKLSLIAGMSGSTPTPPSSTSHEVGAHLRPSPPGTYPLIIDTAIGYLVEAMESPLDTRDCHLRMRVAADCIERALKS